MRQHLGRSINGPWVSGTGVLGRSTAGSRVDAVAPPSTERRARTWTLVALAVLGPPERSLAIDAQAMPCP